MDFKDTLRQTAIGAILFVFLIGAIMLAPNVIISILIVILILILCNLIGYVICSIFDTRWLH